MSIDDIRDQSRAAIHDEFAVLAVVRTGSVEIRDVPVRLHLDLRKPFGDLDREGFAFTIEEGSQAIFDTQHPVRPCTPKRGDVVDFGRGRVFRVEDTHTDTYERYQKVSLVPHKES
jgi:hypothetical protein